MSEYKYPKPKNDDEEEEKCLPLDLIGLKHKYIKRTGSAGSYQYYYGDDKKKGSSDKKKGTTPKEIGNRVMELRKLEKEIPNSDLQAITDTLAMDITGRGRKESMDVSDDLLRYARGEIDKSEIIQKIGKQAVTNAGQKKESGSKTKQKKIMKEYLKLKKEHSDLWDKYFGEHPLTQKYHPNSKRGTKDPKDKEKILKLNEKMKKLEKEWKKIQYERGMSYNLM